MCNLGQNNNNNVIQLFNTVAFSNSFMQTDFVKA